METNEQDGKPRHDALPKLVQISPSAGGDGGGNHDKVERSVRLANVRAKVKALSGKNFGAFSAITDLFAEATLNKASLLDARRAPAELVKLLSTPLAQRRATTYRDLCELGRYFQLPNWHGSDRRQLYMWYHCCQRMRLLEVAEGEELITEAELGDSAYWLLTGTMEEYKTPPPPSPPQTPPPPPSPPPDGDEERPLSGERRSRTGDDCGSRRSSGVGSDLPPIEPPAPPAPPPPPVRAPGREVKVFERLGQEALQGNPYIINVQATSSCQVAVLSRTDYLAVVSLAVRESFEGLRAMSSLMANKGHRQPKALADLVSLLSVTDMFRGMDPEFRHELCGLLEFLALPEGTVLFEEGDKVDFTYVILKGEVVLSRYNEARRTSDDFAVRTSGQQFGTLPALQVGTGSSSAGGGTTNASVSSDKKRNFSARCTQLTEFAIVTKVGYNRLIRSQMQKSLHARLEVLQGMAILSNASSQSILTRIAINCQDETFSAGSTIVDPSCPPSRLFFIVEGQAKMLWVADSPTQVPPGSDRPMDGAAGGSTSTSGAMGGANSSTDGSNVAGLGNGGKSIRKRQLPYVYELALLSRGDVVNGMVLHGKNTCFMVIAATNVKVMSLEVTGGQSALEQIFGREQAIMLRELVRRQAEVHRERAVHMVGVRQTSAAMMDSRGSSMPESATFLQHYIPKTPGAEAMTSGNLSGYAAAAADPSLFVLGAVQHGDIMKLVAAVGQSVLDTLPASRRSAVRAGSGAGSGGGASPGGGGGPFGPAASGGLSQQQQHDQQQQQWDQHQHRDPQQHVTTVVAQAVSIPRTKMRAPSPGMARELGLEAPPPLPLQQSSNSSGYLDRSSLTLLPDPAGGKSRNGRPRAAHRNQLGLPFAGNVAMLVLENHSDLVKVVSPTLCSVDSVTSLRKANSVSYCNDDGEVYDGSYGGDDGSYSYGSSGRGHTLVSVEPQCRSVGSVTSSAAPSSYQQQTPRSVRLSFAAAANDETDNGPTTPPAAARVAVAESDGSPFTESLPALSPLGAGSGDTYGTSSFGEDSYRGDESWRQPRLSTLSQSSVLPGVSSLLHVEPLTLAASQLAAQLHLSPSGVVAAATAAAATSPPPPMTPTRSSACLGASSIPLAAGQVHVPPSNPYKRTAPGGHVTTGAMPSAVLSATAVVQPAASSATARHSSNRQSTIMSMGPLEPGYATSPVPPYSAASLPPSTSSSFNWDNANPIHQHHFLRAISPTFNAGTARNGRGSSITGRASSFTGRASSFTGGGNPSFTGGGNPSITGVSGASFLGSSGPVFTGEASTGADISRMSPSRQSPSREQPATTAAPAVAAGPGPEASPDSVVILPRMLVYETALVEGGSSRGGGSPRYGGRMSSLGTTPVPNPKATSPSAGQTTTVLPALPGTSTSASASATGTGPPPDAHTSRPPPRGLRSMDVAPTYQFGMPRELLGYYSSISRMTAPVVESGVAFTGGIGGRSASNGGTGGERPGGRGPRRRGVSLRDLAGVNGLQRPGGGLRREQSMPLKALEGPELPLEVDTEAPPLQNRKLSEPSLDDLKYILTRWSKKWSQQRTGLGSPGRREGTAAALAQRYHHHPAASYPASEPAATSRGRAGGGGGGSRLGTPLMDLSQYGYTADDMAIRAGLARRDADAAGTGGSKRPVGQLDLFGLPSIGGARPGIDGGVDGGGSFQAPHNHHHHHHRSDQITGQRHSQQPFVH